MPQSTHCETASEIARLAFLSIDDLQIEWSRLFGSAAPKNARREYLLRAITHELQRKQYGGLSNSILRALSKQAVARGARSAASSPRSQTAKPGARIYREWKGAVHEVEVLDRGYRYEGETFKSLSVIARKITGTHWSGPAFFGLKNLSRRSHHAER